MGIRMVEEKAGVDGFMEEYEAAEKNVRLEASLW